MRGLRPVLHSPGDDAFRINSETMESLVSELRAKVAKISTGGGESARESNSAVDRRDSSDEGASRCGQSIGTVFQDFVFAYIAGRHPVDCTVGVHIDEDQRFAGAISDL